MTGTKEDLNNLSQIAPEPFDASQREYLSGFFAGVEQRATVFANFIQPNETQEEDEEQLLIPEERMKQDLHPLDAYYKIVENARDEITPDKEDIFRFKWNGLFFESPVNESFMARLRIPGGQLTSHQLREIAHISEELTTGYIQITTRANFQIRRIEIQNTPEVLRRIQRIGLHTRGAGADNIRNLTCNPTAGVDPAELIDCSPFIHDLSEVILSQRVFYDLPRKFNISFDGGGLVSTAEDTNDIGIKAVQVGDDVMFRIGLGGATGHLAFAQDLGVLVSQHDIIPVVVAILKVFIANGNRGNRKKARLKHLLEDWSLEKYLEETEAVLGKQLQRSELTDDTFVWPSTDLSHSWVGAYEQKQDNLHYLGVSVPVGQITPNQLLRIANLAENYGSGDVRLTVWQNLIIPNIPSAYIETVKKAVEHMDLSWQQSNASTGIVACTGSRHCKYASTDTKDHAATLIKHLESDFELDQPVNIHFTGCPHSCAQHYMGDIGLLGAKTPEGEPAYHVFVGGGFGKNRACGRQIFKALPYTDLHATIETMLNAWQTQRKGKESFQEFTTSKDTETLQTLFAVSTVT